MRTKYTLGRRKEYQIVMNEKSLGRISFRSAGSHSPIDVISIDVKNRIIRLIQSKRKLSGKMMETDEKLKEKILKELNFLNGNYQVITDVL